MDTSASDGKLIVNDQIKPGMSMGSTKKESQQPSASSQKSKKSSAPSVLALKTTLELEAAKEKARIQIELIDKKLAADLAAVEAEEYIPHGSENSNRSDGKIIEEWLEQSQQELKTPGARDYDGPIRILQEVQELASALRDLVHHQHTASTNHNTNLLSRISTYKDLPLFFGDPMEWLSFRASYTESTDVCQFSEIENMWRLRRCLRGPAKEAVSALLITTSPDVVMSTLDLMFGNPEIIISKMFQDIKSLTLSQEYHKDLVYFSIKIKNFATAVHELKYEEYTHGLSVVNKVITKLPTVLLSKWLDYSYPRIAAGTKHRLYILSDFLEDEAIKIPLCCANLMNNDWDDSYRNCNDTINIKLQ